MQLSKDLARFMRFSPLLLSNLEKKSPEECASEHVNRTASRRNLRTTRQVAISSENRAQGYRNTKIPSINVMPLWCGVL